MTKKTNKTKNVDSPENKTIDENAYQSAQEEVQEVSTRGQKPQRKKVYERPSTSGIPQHVIDSFKEDGYALRLVRWAIRGEPDYRYLNRREQEGYEFVSAKELPADYLRMLRVRDTGTVHGLVTNGGDLCLMKIDMDLQKSRTEFFNDQAQKELDSVDVHVLTKRHGLRNTGTKSKVMLREPSFQD